MKLTMSTLTALAICLAATVHGSPTPDNSLLAGEAESILLSRDVCGNGYPGYTRRIGSPCAASNGNHQFCSCDRTNIAKCVDGRWRDGTDCAAARRKCSARLDGTQAVCL